MLDVARHDVKPSKTLPSLVLCCQRVLNANIDSISGLGPDMPHRLVKPVLQGCSANTLLRIERETPHIIEDNEEIWKDMCYRTYPIITDQYDLLEREVPLSWRDEFFILRDAEAKRLEEAGNRIRIQRLEAEELKKQRQVKFTDRVPPAKRSRPWFASPTQPKSLFQKTRADASKLQKSVFGPRMLPPMPASKGFRPAFASSGATLSFGESTTPVHVTTITRRVTSATSTKPIGPPETASKRKQPDSSADHRHPKSPPPAPVIPEQRMQPKLPAPTKKDPMASLFMPKHRAHSQLPNAVRPSHTIR
ncbi:hypothetical protein BD410DRAFT_785781 [Rickenella mellea]|uniref:Elongin-A n=1 Tax=Rickenella mellea TaxID=50990 RepID=A0A4Y7QBR0_9AGAM|nr:hypothetical protein BD410DRAFT_785781 [Rickenella mellea]